MAIGGFASQISREMPPGNLNLKKLDIIIQETDRMEHLVRDMLDFGRPLVLHPAKVDLNELIREIVDLAQAVAGTAGVALRTHLEPHLPDLFLDKQRFKQALLNLIVNAIQASEEGNDVWIKIFTAGEKISLEVIDCGCGLKSEDEKNIFLPFFSTKKKGTGLGLGIVKKIVEAHGYEICFLHNDGEGVTFKISITI